MSEPDSDHLDPEGRTLSSSSPSALPNIFPTIGGKAASALIKLTLLCRVAEITTGGTMSTTPPKANIFVRLLVFFIVYAAIVWAGLVPSIAFLVISAGGFLFFKFRKGAPLHPASARVLKYIAIASALSTAVLASKAMTEREATAKREATEAAITKAKQLISESDFKAAMHTVQSAIPNDDVQTAILKQLTERLAPVFDEEIQKSKVMHLPRETFEQLLASKPVPLDADNALNTKLNEALKAKAGKLKTEYYVRLAQAEKERKQQEKIAKEQARKEEQRKKRIERFGEPPTQSQWDGSYREVEKYLERVANDPDSIKIEGCTGVSHDDSQGWLVGCDFRGRNAFGGLVKNSNWFVIRHGAVIKALPAGTYKP